MRTIKWLAVWSWLIGTISSVFGTSYYFTKFGTPVVADDRILFAGPGWESHRVICISKLDGKKLWEISDSTNTLHPAFAFDQQVVITASSRIEQLNPKDGSRKTLFETGYSRPLLRPSTADILYCAGESSGSQKLKQINARTWTPIWEIAGIERIIAEGEKTLLCGWQIRKPLGKDSFQITASGYAGIVKSSGKESWRQTMPSATWQHGVAVKEWFVVSLGDEVLCMRQENGQILKRVKSPAGQPGVSLANRGDHVVVWSCADRASFSFAGRVYQLSVPELDEFALFSTDFFPLSHAIFGDVVVGRSGGRVDAYSLTDGKKLWRDGQWNWSGVFDGAIYFSEQEPDGKHASVNRIHIKTGEREKLYEELLRDPRQEDLK